jgi:hypothetical protein
MKKYLALFLLLTACHSVPKVQSTRPAAPVATHSQVNNQITDAVTITEKVETKKNDIETKTEIITENKKEVSYAEGPKTVTETTTETKKEIVAEIKANNTVHNTKIPDPPSTWANNKFFWGQMFLLLAVLLFSGWIFYREFLRKDQNEESEEESALKKPTQQKKPKKKLTSRSKS